MSLSLGEKLREAREERGFTLSEVAEQTRISSLYLESIENNDYRNLPGGIFSKGFVKSFAKFVGLNEQEALADYSQILAENQISEETELKLYKPEVLTDDRSGSSMIPTIIVAVVILGLMTAGILFLVNYLRRPADPSVANTAAKPNTNTSEGPANSNTATSSDAPSMATLKVVIKAVGQPILITSTSDGVKADNKIAAESSVTLEPKESLILNYNRWNFKAVQMSINGKSIALPVEPLDKKGQRIEFTINKDNLAKVWSSGSISGEAPPATGDANANVAATTPTAPAQTRPTPLAPKPAVPANSAANTTKPVPANTAKPPSMTGKPPTMTGKPAANHP